MKSTAFLLIFLAYSSNTLAMIQLASKKYARDVHACKYDQFSKKIVPNPEVLVSVKNNNQNVFYKLPATLSVIFEQKITSVGQLCCFYPSLEEAAKTISALVQVNKYFYRSMDDSQTLELIKKLSDHFECSNMKVTETLSIRQAFNRQLIQAYLDIPMIGLCPVTISMLNKAKKNGLDLNFSYDNTYSIPLIMTICSRMQYADKILYWLLENGADINRCSVSGKNGAQYVVEDYKKDVNGVVLSHPDLNIQHMDNNGNILLHSCIYSMLLRTVFNHQNSNHEHDFMLRNIEWLMKKQLDPTIKNNRGLTALELARTRSGNLGNNKIPDKILLVLENAEKDWRAAHGEN